LNNQNDVIIVSAWGREAWLAQKLSHNNIFQVTVMDNYAALPAKTSGEREGPFGIFVPENLDDVKKKYLQGSNYYPVPHGFCVFTPQGPLELHGPLTPFMKKRKILITLFNNLLN